MTYFLSLYILLTSFVPSKFGEPVATLTCKSASGRTIFTATLPEVEYLEKAELVIDNSKLVFSIEDKGGAIFDPTNRVFTVYLESQNGEKHLRFWVTPSSFKKVFSEKGSGSQFHDIYEFQGMLEATEPRKGKENVTPTIELTCKLDYQL